MKPSKLTLFRPHASLATAFSAVLLCHFAAPSASAETYYWDTDGSIAGFGDTAGTWGTSAYWTTVEGGGATHTAFTSPTTADTVNFGSATLALGPIASAIGVNGTVNAGSITFGAGQTTPITLSGGTINLAASSTIRVNNTTNTISAGLTGGDTLLTKAGTGILVLSGSAAFGAGATTIAGGVLAVTGSAVIGTGNLTLAGGILGLNANFSRALGTGADQFRWTASGGFAAYGADRTVTIGTASSSINWTAANFIGGGMHSC